MAFEAKMSAAEYDVLVLKDELAKQTAEREQLAGLTDVTTENLNRMDALEASIEEMRRLISEKISAIERAREGEAARIIDDKRARETREAEWRQSQALAAAAALDRSQTEEKLDQLRVEVDQLSREVEQHLKTMNALSDPKERGDCRNELIRPRVSRQEDVRKKISAFEGRLAHWQHTGTSHRNLKLSGSNLSEVITAQAHTPWRRTT